MDLLKLIDLASKYFADYFSVLFTTLQDPTPAYKPKKRNKTLIINPELMGFALISIAIGTTINSVIPNRPQSADNFTASMVTLIMWIVYSLVIFLTTRLLGKKIVFLEIITISLQLFGTVYVVSNFAAFLWGVALANPAISAMVSNFTFFLLNLWVQGTTVVFKVPIFSMKNLELPQLVIENPLIIFYLVQFILLIIYIPKILYPYYITHRVRLAFLTAVSALFIFSCGLIPYFAALQDDSGPLVVTIPQDETLLTQIAIELVQTNAAINATVKAAQTITAVNAEVEAFYLTQTQAANIPEPTWTASPVFTGTPTLTPLPPTETPTLVTVTP